MVVKPIFFLSYSVLSNILAHYLILILFAEKVSTKQGNMKIPMYEWNVCIDLLMKVYVLFTYL